MNADHLIFYFYLTVFKLPLARLPLFLLAIITVIWIRHFHKQKHSNPSRPGLTGLYDRPKGHPQKCLKAQHEKQIKKWLDQTKGPHGGPFHWTIDKLKVAIEDQFGVVLSRSWVGVLVHQWGFRSKVPRPKHAGSDQAAQQAFKKTS